MYQVLTVDALGRKARAELCWMTMRKSGMRRWDGRGEMCILTRQKMHEWVKAGSPFQVGFVRLAADGVCHPECSRVNEGKLMIWERREIQAELCQGAGKQAVENQDQ